MMLLKDGLTRALLCDGQVSALAVCSTQICQTANIIHGCEPCAAAALGRTLTAAVLMSATLKGKHDKLSVIINGDGIAGKIICTATTAGVIKGYIQNPKANLPVRFDGKLDVGGIVGVGQLTVTRDEGQPQPYIGVSELVSGEIAEDIAQYYAKSEQKPTAVMLGVKCNRSGVVISAGGLFVTPLPGCSESSLEELENKLHSLSGISELIEKYEFMEELLLDNFWDIGIRPLETTGIKYCCDCSRQRMEKALVSLGKNELEELAQQTNTELCCHFCNSKYNFSSADIKQLLGDADE